jgi:single-strand DNA-binding protein
VRAFSVANLNKVHLIGRATREPELKSFSNGGRVAKLGFCVNNRKKNSQSGEWEEEPVYLDCEAYNRGDFGKLADQVDRFVKKGSQLYLEGHLQLDQWEDKASGEKRSKLKVVVDVMQLLDARPKGGEDTGEEKPAPARAAAPASAPKGRIAAPKGGPKVDAEDDDQIPF